MVKLYFVQPRSIFDAFSFLCALSCRPCGCATAGSLSGVCNSSTGACLCKRYVTGVNCSTCVTDFQLLDANNPFGCTAGMSVGVGEFVCMWLCWCVCGCVCLRVGVCLHVGVCGCLFACVCGCVCVWVCVGVWLSVC